MSRSTHQSRHQQKQQLLAQQQQIADNESAAAAAELFDLLCVATTMRQCLGLYRNMCDHLGMRPAPLNEFYPKLKTKVRSWKAQALWKKFDARAAHRAYAKGTACTGSRVLVIGAGPCGLRTAIEAQLLGAKVVVVEKRDRISRNNVLHLWPFVITDLRNLGAKKFYGKFCAGSIDHISIRQLQCILLKVALLLGVEVHEGVSFESTIEPSGDGSGWRAAVSPADHAVSHYEFDVLIGADGKRNTLEGFKRKEFRGKLAIAITANFINKKTEAEAKAEEISGVAFIFNQSFFKELYHTTGIDLENIVYYKDETHYFVMTAKKHSLLDKGVIIQDFADPAELLAPANVNTEKLLDYAREAAGFSTKYQMPNIEFAVNHYGKPDVAMFDFTSMFAAETSCRAIVRKGFRLLQCLVGDSLLEPFWPTGSGCARGFLSSMDAAYALKLWSDPRNSVLGVLAQRESIYRLLNQTTPENLNRDIGSYTVDPATRYPNLNRTSVNVWQVKHLIDTDDKVILEQTFMDTNEGEPPLRRKRRNGDTMSLGTVLLSWICAQLHAYDFTKDLNEVTDIFTNGKVLCALINRYRPDLVDYNSVKDLSPAESNELAFKILDKEMQIPRIMSGKDSLTLNTVDSKVWLNYLEQICEVFRGEVPHVKHPKMDFSDLREKHRTNSALGQPDFSKLLQITSSNKQTKTKSSHHDSVDVPQVVSRRSILAEEQLKRQRGGGVSIVPAPASGASHQQAQNDTTPRRAKKRRSAEKAANIEERQQRLKDIEENRQERVSKRRQQRYQQTQNFYKSLHMLQANTLLRESDDSTPFEDYSIFLYRQQAPEFNDRVKDLEKKLLYPDRDRSDIPSAMPRGNADEQFNDRIKSMEQRMAIPRNQQGTEKKPKDLMRAIGKIESSDWNVREIEKKIEQSRKTEVHGPKGREKVPKWSKEQFQARQKKMSKPARQESVEEKFKEIDQTLKNLDKQLKEGRNLEVGERGRNKVASIAGQFFKKDESNTNSDDKNPSNTVVPKSSSKVALAFKKQAASEKCHFCKQTVYLMEKINAEGLILHRSCLKCHHCHTNLRPGGYAFDRDDPQGRFYCTQHYRLPAKAMPKPVMRRSTHRKSAHLQQQNQQTGEIVAAVAASSTTAQAISNPDEPLTPEKLRVHADNVAQLDLLDRGQTPERIEFENADALSDGGDPSEEHIIDEHEWSGRNFLPESNNDSESDLSSSDESDSESESDMFEEANDSPIGAQTLQLVTDWIGKQNYTDSDDSDDFYDSSDGAADDGKDDTEGEEIKKARELRREEVRLLPLPPNLPTDTETEAKQLNNENKENINASTMEQKSDMMTISDKNLKNLINMDKGSEKSGLSDRSFQSTQSLTEESPKQTATKAVLKSTPSLTKADIEKLEQNSDRKLSAEIDAISEKLYRLNSVVKMNKDLEVLAKENLVKSDIFKKLNMKEKWLADNNVGNVNPLAPKSRFEDKIEKIMKKPESQPDQQHGIHNAGSTNGTSQITMTTPPDRKSTLNASPHAKRKGSANTSRSNSFKSNASSPKLKAKNSAIDTNDNKMQIENILGIVKSIDLSRNGLNTDKEEVSENRFSPQPNKRMTEKMKEIQAESFAGKMDSIKSHYVEPTVSSQSGSNLDLSKYFPNQKLEKPSSPAMNKNQKNLKDVDLAKYFPPSPLPQRKSSVVTVADKLKQSQTDRALETSSNNSSPQARPKNVVNNLATSTHENAISKTKTMPSLRDHQLDGAADMTRKMTPTKIKTSTAAGTPTKKGGIKIIKKIVPKGMKGKRTMIGGNRALTIATKKNLDESDRILNEILDTDGQTVRSPSMEYQKLFQDEKSPSDDISDKIERILEESGIDLGIPRKEDRRQRLKKTKSLGEDDFSQSSRKLSLQQDGSRDDNDNGRRLSGVQNILKRFESMSSVKSDASGTNGAFKLRRMESSTSNLDKSHESIQSRESDIQTSDLEKTMEYLKTEWRNEATNFLQKKREKFFAKKKQEKPEPPTEEQKKARNESLPIQYRDSKIAKFFGLAPKSPEKIAKKKSPEKKLNDRRSKSKSKSPKITRRNQIKAPNTNKSYNSMEELAILSALKKSEKDAERHKSDAIKDRKLDKEKCKGECLNALESLNRVQKDNINVSGKSAEILQKEMPAEKGDIDQGLNGENINTPTQRVEDIKNLPKTGCDKSRSSSRRGSLASIQSRRLSDVSLVDNIDVVPQVSNIQPEVNEMKNDEEKKNKPERAIEQEIAQEDECDSLRTTMSKSPSEALVTVQMRGSSEDESIEKLFSQFSDEMLVDVEFDSNDEVVAITPLLDLAKADPGQKANFLENEPAKDSDGGPHHPHINEKRSELQDWINKSSNEVEASESKNHFSTSNSNDLDGNQFPLRPQRRQKSTSSSSEPSSAPTAPQRLKKKLNKLCPSDMLPSVQDVLTHLKDEDQSSYTAPKKFPRALEENISEPPDQVDGILTQVKNTSETISKPEKLNLQDQACNKSVPSQQTCDGGSPTHKKETGSKTGSNFSPLVSLRSSLSSIKSLDLLNSIPIPKILTRKLEETTPVRGPEADQRNKNKNSKVPSKEKSLEWDMEKLPNSPMPRERFVHPRKSEESTPVRATEADQRNKNQTSKVPSKEKSLEWDMEKLPNSPMPRERFDHPKKPEETTTVRGPETDQRNKNQNSKVPSKEKSLEWDMEKLPNSPMPRERFVHPERGSLKDKRLHEKSPSNSLKLLNSLPQKNTVTDEKSLRKALIERDIAYEKLEKPQLEFGEQSRERSATQKLPTPLPLSVPQTPIQLSRANTQEKSLPNRSGTPPMLKKLVIPGETMSTTSTPQTPKSSRRSSFAFIELMDNGEPVIVPMPKKLELPKIIPRYVPDYEDKEIAKVFKNRPWPRPELDVIESSASPEPTENKETVKNQKSDSPIAEVFKNRQWPDGKTDFSKLQSPERRTGEASKSQNDLSRPISTDRTSTRTRPNASQSLLMLAPSRSIRSSVDTEPQSHFSSPDRSENSADTSIWLNPPQRPATQRLSRTPPPTVEMDASTRLLLNRSKQLHDRKRDFMNERNLERNPYMRNMVDDERHQRAVSENEDELDTYRPKHYSRTNNAFTRFPTSTALGRTQHEKRSYRDFISPPHTTYSSANDYGSGGNARRSYYGSSLPLGSSLIYQNPLGASYGLNTPGYDRSYMDYSRKSPSKLPSSSYLGSRSYTNRDSCVQSDSESTSTDNKVELNSATEISTDSEFDHDEVIRETPKIFIDDTHIRKPTKVQIKSAIVESLSGQRFHSAINAQSTKGGSYLKKYQAPNPPTLQFKPLVQVDPTLLNSNRGGPLQNPRQGDYLLNKTASTEGIASKKSLELKKRYLLGGEQTNGNKIQKSGSTSVLDSRIRSFQSNISECQKLLNPSSDISASMKTFLDRTKLGDNSSNSNKNDLLMRSATTNVLKDLKVEITIQKASSTASTDNEKENVFVNSKNELNKGMEYSDAVNITLLGKIDQIDKKEKNSSPTTPTNNNNKQVVIETIDLTTPEKPPPLEAPEKDQIIDLTTPEKETPTQKENEKVKEKVSLLRADSNKIADATCESPVKSDKTLVDDDMSKPDVSKDVKQTIPDILHHVEKEQELEKHLKGISQKGSDERDRERERLLSNSGDEEKMDSPEKREGNFENDTVQIQVPNIPWNTRNKNISSETNSSWSSSSSTSIEDIQHYILESTTSPDTNNTNGLSVPRVEVHDTSGTLMQIDSLMIVDGKYIGDPEDLKFMEIPEGVIVPETAATKTTEVVDEDMDNEPVTATPEPAEPTIIEAKAKQQKETSSSPPPPPLPEQGPPLPERGPPVLKPTNLKFDTKNENKIESLKHLPLIVEQNVEQTKAVKPITLNLCSIAVNAPVKPMPRVTPTTPTGDPTTPLTDNDKTPTAEILSRSSDSETGTGQVMTETELSDWTADDCISENFIDTEFVLNSNKGTIKRNKKNKRRSSDTTSKRLPSSAEVIHEVVTMAPVVDLESMFNSIDIEDIEFMDTGSEGSYAEAYSATNTALLRNRGYMEFIDNKKTHPNPGTLNRNLGPEPSPRKMTTKRDEKLGIDYIEQGAYLMQNELGAEASHDLLKTPVNETQPQLESEVVDPSHAQSQIQTSSLMTQSLTDSSTLNDLEDDSLGVISASTTTKPTTTATTEESEALTVVTSPMDSSSPKTKGSRHKELNSQEDSKENDTPSSSDKNPKTSQSTCSPATSSKEGGTASKSGSLSGHHPKVTTPTATGDEQLSYEDYVRALQQKITQISSAGLRDSLESRKQRRKSSKGEAPAVGSLAATAVNATQTVIDQATHKPNEAEHKITDAIKIDIPLSVGKNGGEPISHSNTTQPHKVPEIPTLTRRLEEISKERTKQKDLIHDLVMDKLQSKKQLNAEKRLHRSRQRTMLTSGANGGYSSGSSLSPTPKIAASDPSCANKAHYHISTAIPSPSERHPVIENPYQKSSPYTYKAGHNAPLSSSASASVSQRLPHSNGHLDLKNVDIINQDNLNLNRTSLSSAAHVTRGAENLVENDDNPSHSNASTCGFAKPNPPLAPASAPAQKTTIGDKLLSSVSTENLRTEARARARLMSNSELGLSPEEKKYLLQRQGLFSEHNTKSGKPIKLPLSSSTQNSSKDIKMSASKSVNDLAYMSSLRLEPLADSNLNTKSIPALADFTSDPNLLLSSTSIPNDENRRPKTKPSRRQKDPERRKSLIQSISSLFHKDKKHKTPEGGNVTANAAHSVQTERPGTSGSSTTTASGSVDGVLSLFRISPKSKEKSKEKDGNLMSSTSRKTPHEVSNSQDITKQTTPKHNNKKQQQQSSIPNASSRTSSTAFSSSSPQLYIHRPSYMNSNNDEQTPPPIPPLPINYQRSDDESYATETREQKKQRAISKAVRQAELKRLRIAQEIQREQEEIEVQLKELEARGVLIEKALRGEDQSVDSVCESAQNIGNSDEKLLKELLEIWRNITQLKKRDEELGIRQKELQLEHRHAQLKEELNLRLSCNKLDKSSADVAAEGAILNEMLEIVAKRASLRPTVSSADLTKTSTDILQTASTSTAARNVLAAATKTSAEAGRVNLNTLGVQLPPDSNESNI